MQLEQQFIQEVIKAIDVIVLSQRDNIDGCQLNSSVKSDSSIVTELDLLLSQKIQAISQKFFPFVNYIDEEVESVVNFPAIVVDPIDGTKEINQGISECAVSLAFMNSDNIEDPLNFAMIYNPLNGFLLHSFKLKPLIGSSYSNNLRVMISRTEWEKMHLVSTQDIHYIPIGSIAYKLALLANGMFEAVISFREKNIWDIAAGCVLLSQAGGSMFNVNFVKIEKLDEITMTGPLIWAREETILAKLKGLK